MLRTDEWAQLIMLEQDRESSKPHRSTDTRQQKRGEDNEGHYRVNVPATLHDNLGGDRAHRWHTPSAILSSFVRISRRLDDKQHFPTIASLKRE